MFQAKQIRKVYRIDLNKWETKMLYNGTKYWFFYDIFGEPTLSSRKRLSGKKNVMTKSIPCHPSPAMKAETEQWLVNIIDTKYMSGKPVRLVAFPIG